MSDKEPKAPLLPNEAERKGRRRFGALRGKAPVTDAFFEPLPDEELVAWEG